jgi:dihydrofolate reductase
MAATDTVLLGRRLYEEWSAYWSGKGADDDPFADFINDVHKIVVSTTLESVGWRNATLVRGDAESAIARLKQGEGGNIAVNGSITLARSLLRSGLVDELRLLLFPVIVGSGRRLFEDLGEIPLRLIEAKPLPTGVVSLTYRRSDGPRRA